MAKVEHKESPMITERSLYYPTLSFSLSVSMSLCHSLCGQAVCASMLVIRTNRDERGRRGYTLCTREGRMKEKKIRENKTPCRHEGNTRDLIILAHTYFHNWLLSFSCITGMFHHNTTIQMIVSSWKKILPLPVHIRCSFTWRVLKKEKRERLSKGCNRLVMNKILHQN